MLDPTYCGLPLVCKVGTSKNGDFQRILLSLAVGDALEFGKYFWFILQGSGGGSGDGSGASLTGASRPALDAFAVMRRAAAEVHYPASPPSPPPRPPPAPPPPQKKKKIIKSLVPCLLFICVWTRNRILSLHGLMQSNCWQSVEGQPSPPFSYPSDNTTSFQAGSTCRP